MASDGKVAGREQRDREQPQGEREPDGGGRETGRRPLLEVCAHAWNYANLACLHLSSYVLHPPQRCRVLVTICHCPDEDPRTAEVLEWFAANGTPLNVEWRWHAMARPRLCRRAIGRNEVAQRTRADWVLYADIDHLWGAGALDAAAGALAAAGRRGARLCYPHRILVSDPPEAGDEEIARVTEPGIYAVHPGRFKPRRQPRAIGGTQWVHGDVARERGYLPGHPKHQRPAQRWRRTFGDKAFRYSLGLDNPNGVPVSVPGVYRLRHSRYGRKHVGVQL